MQPNENVDQEAITEKQTERKFEEQQADISKDPSKQIQAAEDQKRADQEGLERVMAANAEGESQDSNAISGGSERATDKQGKKLVNPLLEDRASRGHVTDQKSTRANKKAGELKQPSSTPDSKRH